MAKATQRLRWMGLAALCWLAVLSATPAAEAQDVMRIGSVAGADAGDLVVIPLRLQDRAGTALDSGAQPQRAFHSFSVTVEATPASAVASAEIVRAGLTAGLAPRFETRVATASRRSWIASFSEPVIFDGSSQAIAQLRLRIAPGAAPGSAIALELVAATTALSNASGTVFETERNGQLGLIDGTIQIGGSGCTTDTTLCLLDDRFSVEVAWQDFQGATGVGNAVPLTDETGYFWFFSPDNVEVVLKTLDGRGINGFFWVFYGALSDVQYEITVTDSVTRQVRTYFNPSGTFASVGDIEAFPGGVASVPAKVPPGGPRAGVLALPIASAGAATAKQGTCAPSATRLCLLDGRFALEMTWEDFDGLTGTGDAETLTGETGYFWFFNPDNVEIVAKVLDGRAINGRFWVFYGALSNVRFNLTVTDTATGTSKTYENPLGSFGSVGDTSAF